MITCEAVGSLSRRWRSNLQVNWQTKGSWVLFIYLEFFKVMYSISSGKKNQTERCISFKMASPNVICGFCVVYFFSYQNSVKLSGYYKLICFPLFCLVFFF